MKKYFAQLRPLERRLAVGFLVAFILVLNYLFIWPHFSDWGTLQRRLAAAHQKLKLYHAAIALSAKYQARVRALEKQGDSVPREDQVVNFLRAIETQASRSGVNIMNTSRQMTHTNEFFVEQTQNITVEANDEQLVDFLYKLGDTASMIRVRDLELQPDPHHEHLRASIRLVASYQKNLPGTAMDPAPAKSGITTAK